MIITIYSFLVAILTVIYLFFVFRLITGWKRMKKKHIHSSDKKENLCVIIPARNESAIIENCIYSISNQNYPKTDYNVIIVNDNSTDDTEKIVLEYINKHNIENIRLVNMANGESGKKTAIETAVNLTPSNIIVITDADCTHNPDWLNEINNFYSTHNSDMIIGPVKMNHTNFFTKILSLEFMGLSGLAGASASLKKPILCNGANMSFRKEVFASVGGYNNYKNYASGDDMHLLEKVKKTNSFKIDYLMSKSAITYTSPPKSFIEFFNQRLRWSAKGKSYSDPTIIRSAILVAAFNLSIVISLVLACIYCGFVEITAIQVLSKLTIDFLFLFLVADFFSNKRLLFLYLPMQILYPFYVTFFSITGLFVSGYNWKNRYYSQ